ncbi:hypothetical protein DRO66_11900 [Candidatus Bathyarchaeota archaeon]|nr:MAG: hypothetical protein DRO66_11900 [Candidatus Bathyarchaeota archaeon]
MAVPAGLLIAGYGLSAISKFMAADAQSDALLDASKAAKLRSERILDLNLIQTDISKRRRFSLVGEQQVAAISMGISMASGSVMKAVNQTYQLIEEQIKLDTEKAEFEASLAMSEAANLKAQAGKARTAGGIGIAADIVGLAGKL